MGRRSISTTKAGKFMNPTDQARKEACPKEFKKNQKQRLQVRQAVIKQKDPKNLLNDMELLDKMEFDSKNPPPYSVKVIQEKRRKLKETWTKIYQFYQRKDPKQAYELKQMELDYERRHQHMIYVYESIMQAQRVKTDDIPLPMSSGTHSTITATNFIEILMPPTYIPQPAALNPSPKSSSTTTPQPKSILKPINTNTFNITTTNKELLIKYAASFDGVPQSPTNTMAPDLLEFECDDDENELGLRLDDRFSKQIDRSKKIRFNETTSTIDIQMTLSQPPPPPPLQTNLLLPAPQLPTASASTVVSPYLSGKLALQAQQVAAVMGATPSSKSKLLTSTSSHNNKSTLKILEALLELKNRPGLSRQLIFLIYNGHLNVLRGGRMPREQSKANYLRKCSEDLKKNPRTSIAIASLRHMYDILNNSSKAFKEVESEIMMSLMKNLCASLLKCHNNAYEKAKLAQKKFDHKSLIDDIFTHAEVVKTHLNAMRFILQEGNLYLNFPRAFELWDILIMSEHSCDWDKQIGNWIEWFIECYSDLNELAR